MAQGQKQTISFTVQQAPQPPHVFPLGKGGKFGTLRPKQIVCSLQDSTTYFMILAMFLSMVWSLVHFQEPTKKDWFGNFVTGLLSALMVLTVIIFGYAMMSNGFLAGITLIASRTVQLLVILAACAMGIVNTNTARAETGDAIGISTIILSALAAIFCRSLYHCKIA